MIAYTNATCERVLHYAGEGIEPHIIAQICFVSVATVQEIIHRHSKPVEKLSELCGVSQMHVDYKPEEMRLVVSLEFTGVSANDLKLVTAKVSRLLS